MHYHFKHVGVIVSICHDRMNQSAAFPSLMKSVKNAISVILRIKPFGKQSHDIMSCHVVCNLACQRFRSDRGFRHH
jgi:hypothetical protein